MKAAVLFALLVIYAPSTRGQGTQSSAENLEDLVRRVFVVPSKAFGGDRRVLSMPGSRACEAIVVINDARSGEILRAVFHFEEDQLVYLCVTGTAIARPVVPEEAYDRRMHAIAVIQELMGMCCASEVVQDRGQTTTQLRWLNSPMPQGFTFSLSFDRSGLPITGGVPSCVGPGV